MIYDEQSESLECGTPVPLCFGFSSNIIKENFYARLAAFTTAQDN